jgi:fatty-acyl-CoA synthase
MSPGVPGQTPQCFHLTALLNAFSHYRDRVAIVYAGKSTTYGEALEEVFRLARAMFARGLRRGDGVAGLNVNTPRTMLTQLAAQLIGCYYSAIPANLSITEQANTLADTGAIALVFESLESETRAAGITERVRIPMVLSLGPSSVGDNLLALASCQPAEPLTPQGHDDDLAELTYTGGSTSGSPKGVLYTFGRNATLTRYLEASARRGTVDSVVFSTEPCRFLRFLPFTTIPWETTVPILMKGGTIFLHKGFEAGRALSTIEQERITVVAMPPSFLYQLLDHPDLNTTDTSSLRLIVYAGAPAVPDRLEQALSRFGPVLLQYYGQTETRMISVLDPADHASGHPTVLRSVGKPLRGIEVQIRDSDGGLLGTGSVGEVCVRSPIAMNGYWRKPELTADTMGDGWVRTNDLGYLDAEDYLYLVDRLTDMVIVNGYNCYTLEVEEALTHHPSVRQATVVGLPDERTGEAIHAVVVRQPNAQVAEEELRALVREHKGRLHEPRTIVFLDEIPLTLIGKPDKNAIRAELARRARGD